VLRSKRRKHAADVDIVVKLLSELTQLTSDSVMYSLLDDFISKLHDMMSSSSRQTQLSVDVSTLDHMLQVAVEVSLFSSSLRLIFSAYIVYAL